MSSTEHGIGIAERGGEFIEQQLRARVAVRLKDDVDLAEAALPRRRQRGANLGGMMAVVVDHGDAVGAALELEAAIHAVEVGQAFADLVDRNVQSNADGDGGSGVAHVVLAGNVQLEIRPGPGRDSARESGWQRGAPSIAAALQMSVMRKSEPSRVP